MPETTSYPRRRHPRLAGYDYLTPGYYFITVCIHHRLPLFGSIAESTMRLSPAGQMAQDAWHDVVALHPGVAIDTAAVLPDHLHAIVVLEDDPQRTLSLPDVVHRYKSLTTKRYAHGVREQGWPRFAGSLWQESFHDRVIRRDGELDEVRRYIVENAMRWGVGRARAEGGQDG